MKINQVAIQLYTLRDACKTESDFASTIARVKQIGYQAAQVSGISPDISPETAAKICADNGVTICAAHSDAMLLRENPQKALDDLLAMGCNLTAFPFPANVDFTDSASVKALISDLETAGELFAKNNCILTYHNHDVEFTRLGHETVMDYIFRCVDPKFLAFELDTYWVQAGGCDPVKWCKKVANRLPILHLKDYAVYPDRKISFAEIGYGNLDFPAIIAAAESSGCKWFAVEQDTCPGDPFDSIKKSFDYIAANLCES
ncbi:MAG: sugar phosphate isomerase/epimerase family protein [Chthoniobacterales bacterium]